MRLNRIVVERSIYAVGAALLLAASACTQLSGDGDAGMDPSGDPNAIPCESRADCPDQANWECQGVCLQLCASDDVCPATQYCDDGFCRNGCRPGNCPDAEQICFQGACVDRDAANSCASKCDCEPGEVCTDGICTDPPDECGSSDDCGRGPDDACEAFSCNGFTRQCTYPDAPDCVDDDDCAVRPGCSEGCTCAPSGACVSNAGCTEETEAEDCGPSGYCTPELSCDALPACESGGSCPAGLVCDDLTMQCTRPVPCSDSTECTEAPATYCDTTENPARCVIPTCMNGGVTCPAGQTCNPGTQQCEQDVMMGDSCMTNADCSNAPWPNTEYCNVPFGMQQGNCAPGCQNNLSCPSNQTCNGAHQCVTGGGNMGGNDGSAGSTCAAIEDCQAGLVCHLLEGTCQETCGDTSTPCDPASDTSCCALTGYAQCTPGIIFSFCRQ